MVKVTVKDKYLNVRVGKPSVNADCFQFIAPGSEIEVDGKLYKGDAFLGIDTWMKDGAGNYYWSGGVGLPAAPVADGLLDYNVKSALTEEVRNTKGENVTVGVVDTGCFKHAAFSQINLTGKNFIDGNDDFRDRSSVSHGTFVSGIIGAGACAGNKMTGVAPNVNLIVAKIAVDGEISNRQAVLQGMQWLVDQQPDIINCSFDFSPLSDEEKFKELFFSDKGKRIIWVGAGQDDEGVFNNSLFFPGRSSNFIAVGSLRVAVLQQKDISQLNGKLKYLLLETDFQSTDRFGTYGSTPGSSFATALVTGNLALVVSHLKSSQATVMPQDAINFLDGVLDQLNSPIQLGTPFIILKK